MYHLVLKCVKYDKDVRYCKIFLKLSMWVELDPENTSSSIRTVLVAKLR